MRSLRRTGVYDRIGLALSEYAPYSVRQRVMADLEIWIQNIYDCGQEGDPCRCLGMCGCFMRAPRKYLWRWARAKCYKLCALFGAFCLGILYQLWHELGEILWNAIEWTESDFLGHLHIWMLNMMYPGPLDCPCLC